MSAAKELRERVADSMARLPPRQRDVLVLATYENLTTDEIASVLQISNANVHSTLYVARQRMRKLLQPYLAET